MTTTTDQTVSQPQTQPKPAPRKRQPSRATRAAGKTAQQGKGGNGKPAPGPATVKPAPKAAKPANEGPTINAQKNMIADWMIKLVGEQCTAAVAKEIGVPLDLLKSEAGRGLSYLPGSAWHRNLTSPGTNRGQRHKI